MAHGEIWKIERIDLYPYLGNSAIGSIGRKSKDKELFTLLVPSFPLLSYRLEFIFPRFGILHL